MLRIIFQAAAWLTLIAIITATIVPVGLRPQSGFGPEPERIAAFLILGVMFSFAYDWRWKVTVSFMVATGFGLEAMQMLSQTRDPAFDDAVIKAVAGATGVLIGRVVAKRIG